MSSVTSYTIIPVFKDTYEDLFRAGMVGSEEEITLKKLEDNLAPEDIMRNLVLSRVVGHGSYSLLGGLIPNSSLVTSKYMRLLNSRNALAVLGVRESDEMSTYVKRYVDAVTSDNIGANKSMRLYVNMILSMDDGSKNRSNPSLVDSESTPEEDFAVKMTPDGIVYLIVPDEIDLMYIVTGSIKAVVEGVCDIEGYEGFQRMPTEVIRRYLLPH